MIDFGVVEPVFCILFATNFFEKNFKVFGGGGIQRETHLLFSSLFFFSLLKYICFHQPQTIL